MLKRVEIDEIANLVLHQLKHYWIKFNEENIASGVERAISRVEEDFSMSALSRLFDGERVVISPYHSVTWMIFLYHLSYELAKDGFIHEADLVYYLNKAMHAIDWYYQIKLPIHFMAEHPLGSVLGRANYGDYLFVYQGTTVGGNRKAGKLYYPSLGNNVVLYANSIILGDSHIGNNVIISADSYIINQNIPDNCIVFGKSPHLSFKFKTEEEMKRMTESFWKW